MLKYETHLHTKPISACASKTVREQLALYRELGYDGVFITNHFLDGNIRLTSSGSYQEKIAEYFSAVDEGKALAPEFGIRVFSGVEMSYAGTDFLVYGLDTEWYMAHPEIMDMRPSEKFPFLMSEGALVVHAHPYREATYIDHIRLFPRCVQGVEVDNACRTELENQMAASYAKAYGLLSFAGSDNHHGASTGRLAGVAFETPIADELDFVRRVKAGEAELFSLNLPKTQN